MIAESLAHLDSVRIVSMSTLVVEVAREVGATVIVRGLRAVSDFENELQMAQMNQHLSGIETLFLPDELDALVRGVAPHPRGRPLRRRRERVRAAPGRPQAEGAAAVTDVHDTEGTEREPDATAAEPGGVEDLLEELIEIVTSAKSMPLSSSAIITRDEVLDLLEAVRDELPEELRRARRMLKDHEELLAAARREAADIVGDARVQSERMVQRTEIVRQAEHRAVRIVEDAEAEGRQMRHEAEDYVDQKLAGFEIVLDRTMKTVRAGRERLASVPAPQEQPGDEPQGELGDDAWLVGRGALRPGPRVTQERAAADRSSSAVAALAQAPRDAAPARGRRPDRRAGGHQLPGSGGLRRRRGRRARVDARRRRGDRDRVRRLGGRVPALPRAGEGAPRRAGPRGLLGRPGPRARLRDDARLARSRTARPRCLYPRVAARAALWARLPRALSGLRREPQPRDLYLHGEARPAVGCALRARCTRSRTRVERVTMAVPRRRPRSRRAEAAAPRPGR